MCVCTCVGGCVDGLSYCSTSYYKITVSKGTQIFDLDQIQNQCGRSTIRSSSSPNTGVTSLLVTVRQEKKRERHPEVEEKSQTKCVSVTALCVNDVCHLK